MKSVTTRELAISFAKKIRRKLPRSIQRLLTAPVLAMRHRRHQFDLSTLRSPKRFTGTHIAVAGLFSTTTGLGRAAELICLTLEKRGHHITRVDLTHPLGVRVGSYCPDAIAPSDCKNESISDLIVVINPDYSTLHLFEKAWLVNRCIIGHWIFEVEVLPAYWGRASQSFDEIWAPTHLVLDVIKKYLPPDKPTGVLPYAVALDPFPQPSLHDRNNARKALNIDAQTFVVGYSFATASNYYRKNPEQLVLAFTSAFPAEQDVLLILRSHDLSEYGPEARRLRKVVKSDKRIQLFDGSRRIDLSTFYSVLDVYASPSRGEGYGLNLVEASQAGLDVITPGWRLAPEIQALPKMHTVQSTLVPLKEYQGHYAAVRGAVWAEPSTSEMVDKLRQLYAAKLQISADSAEGSTPSVDLHPRSANQMR